jgi:hypothetical protein
MPTVSLDVTRSGWGGDVKEIEKAIVSLQEYLFWILQVLDSGNVKYLNTNRTVIRSEDRTTLLDGSQIKMLDIDKDERLVMGYNSETNKYEFTMHNKSGATTITLDDDGNAVFTGKITASDIEGGTITGTRIESDSTIDVETDLRVGESIYLTSEDDSAVGTVKRIQMFEDNNDLRRVRIEAERKASDEVELKIVAGKAIISTLDGLFNGAGERYALERAGVNGSFTTVDGKTIVVENGLIKSIT